MSLYPLKFNPIIQERIWGGNKLKRSLNKKASFIGAGESWELSGVSENVSVLANGPLHGTSLAFLIESHKEDLLGPTVYEVFGNEFPVLIKFIDAAQDLSIQVHPNESLAQARHNCPGKNEMWYVMEATPEARLIVGFKEGVDQALYEEKLEGQVLETILEQHKVKQGDTFYIETGTIHAIGAGVLLAEIQQTSDVTYRVYDFNRKDAAGKSRALHTEAALSALDFKHKVNYKTSYTQDLNRANPMVESPYFVTNYLPVKGKYKVSGDLKASFRIYICVKGSGEISNAFGNEHIGYGETVLMAACSEFIEIESPAGALFLEVYYP